MAQSTLIAWTNLAKGAVISATSNATNMAPSNVAQDQGAPSSGWQTAPGVTTATLTIVPQGLITRPTWNVMGLFRSNLTSSATVIHKLWVNGLGVFGRVWPPLPNLSISPINGYGQVVSVVNSPVGVAADYMTIDISDPTNPDGFINVPLVFGGPAWLPAVAASWNSSVGRDDSTDEVVARGGQEYPTPRWTRRRFELRLEGIQQSELWAQQGELDRYSRGGSNVLVVLNIASPNVQQEAIFGRCKATADVTYPSQAGDARAWAASITERL